MLISYELSWECIEHSYNFWWTENLVNGDARSAGPFELVTNRRLTAVELADYCNAQWSLPEYDGEEILENYNDIDIYRSLDAADATGTEKFI